MTVAVSGDYGKPRPALVIQSDFLAETESVIVCLLTTTRREAPAFRIDIAPEPATGLREPSQIMIDKLMTVRRDRCGQPIGRMQASAMATVDRALAFVTGLAD